MPLTDLMGRYCRRGFTAADPQEIWKRYKQGESLNSIRCLFGRPSSSIYGYLSPPGGIKQASFWVEDAIFDVNGNIFNGLQAIEDVYALGLVIGGISHQIQGPRAGLINQDFDTMFLDGLSQDPEQLTQISHLEYMREAGAEAVELVMWLIMRAALGDNVEEIYRFLHVPASSTGVGSIILETRE